MLMQHTREPKVSDPRRVIAVDQNVALHIVSLNRNPQKNQHTLFRSACTDSQPWRYFSPRATSASCRSGFRLAHTLVMGGTFTSFSRLVSGHAVINSIIVPCSIHSETIIQVCGDLTAPTNGNRFGCLNCFHNTTSQQKLCPTLVSA